MMKHEPRLEYSPLEPRILINNPINIAAEKKGISASCSLQICRFVGTMVNSDNHQEEYHGSQNFVPEKHTLDYRLYRCRRIALRLLPLSISNWGSPLQLRAYGLVSRSLWTDLLTPPANYPTIRPR